MLSKYFYMTYTFIISDESVNADGFVIQTKGIRTERFKKNPVMLYMHAREKGVIGRWDNIRTEGSQLIADAVFDENNPLGKEVKERVDGGFLRSASIGLSQLREDRRRRHRNGLRTDRGVDRRYPVQSERRQTVRQKGAYRIEP